METTPHLYYSREPSALGERMGGELAILHVNSGTYFGLNEIGAEIWDLLEQPRTLAQIVQHLQEIYEVDEDRCRADTQTLLTQLEAGQLIQSVPRGD